MRAIYDFLAGTVGPHIGSGCPVLLYHRISDNPSLLAVSPKVFAQQLVWLQSAGYTAITPADAYRYLAAKQPLPNRSVLITFDDGFKDNFTVAAPLLRQYKFTATFFIAAGFIGGQSDFCTRPEDKGKPMMSAAEITALAKQGFTIANHFTSHRPLSEMTAEQIVSEYQTCAVQLQQLTGSNDGRSYAAYPRGKVTEQVTNALQAAGVQLGFGTRPGLLSVNTEALRIPRISIFNTDQESRFKAKLSSLHYWMLRKLNRA